MTEQKSQPKGHARNNGAVPANDTAGGKATEELRLVKAHGPWAAKLRLDKSGSLKSSLSNIVQILTNDKEYAGKFRLDEMSGDVMLGALRCPRSPGSR